MRAKEVQTRATNQRGRTTTEASDQGVHPAADAHRLGNLARKTRSPRQEVTHLQRKHPLPKPSRVGLSRKQPAHRHLPSISIVRFFCQQEETSNKIRAIKI